MDIIQCQLTNSQTLLDNTHTYTTPEEGSLGFSYNLDLFLQITHNPALDYQ